MRVWGTVERSFHKRHDGLYAELISHFVHFADAQGNIQTKLDRSEWGKNLYRENDRDNSFDGAIIIVEDGKEKRLVVCQTNMVVKK